MIEFVVKQLSQQKSQRDDEPKIKICKNRVWSRHHSLFWKITKKKNKTRYAKNKILGPRVGYA